LNWLLFDVILDHPKLAVPDTAVTPPPNVIVFAWVKLFPTVETVPLVVDDPYPWELWLPGGE
jgi:hypothetical protein